MKKIYLGMCVHRNLRTKILNQTRIIESYNQTKITDINNQFKSLENYSGNDFKFEFQMLDGDAAIDRSRGRMATHFLETRKDCDILFFIDDDIVYKADDFIKMMKIMIEKDLDIFGATYVTKNMQKPSFTFRGLKDIDKFYFGTNGEVREIMFLSNGCMAIQRRVLEKIVKDKLVKKAFCGHAAQYYPFFMPMVVDIFDRTEALSEDWAFCYRARKAGFKIWMDCSVRLGHVGDYVFDWDDIVRPPKQQNNIEVDIQIH